MSLFLVFIFIIVAFVATAFWEAYSEGEYGGAIRQVGWRFKLFGYNVNAYHFWLWIVMYPVLLAIPLLVAYSRQLLGTILAGYFLGMVIEDFLWFIVNPRWPFSDFNSQKVTWYPWLKLGKFELPFFYLPFIIFAFLSWWFLIKS